MPPPPGWKVAGGPTACRVNDHRQFSLQLQVEGHRLQPSGAGDQSAPEGWRAAGHVGRERGGGPCVHHIRGEEEQLVSK